LWFTLVASCMFVVSVTSTCLTFLH